MFNAPVAVGLRAVQGGGEIFRTAFFELVDARQAFKERIKKRFPNEPALRAEILELFCQANLERQSRDKQLTIRKFNAGY